MPEAATNRAYLSLGSNIDAVQHLPWAVRELQTFGTIAAVSSIWETPPVGYTDQPMFHNAAVLLETPLSIEALRQTAIPAIEAKLGRIRDPQQRYGPRTIDVDLILFNDEVHADGARRVPHPDLLRQAFVAIPIAELDPDYRHPEDGRTLTQIAASLADSLPGIRVRPDLNLMPNSARDQ